MEEAPGQYLESPPPVLVTASQEAEDFARVWTSIYDTVMRETRDHAVARRTASDAWTEFAASSSRT